MTKETLASFLNTKILGNTLYIHTELPSTNDTLKQLAADAPDGTVIIAEHQTAGRGRRGRSFYSPKGCGIYMSVLFKRPLSAEQVGLFTSAAAVAVARTIEALLPIEVQIKWVNDLLVHGKKVCGILAEGTPDGVVLGIGINVSTTQFPADIAAIASSLLKESGQAPDPAVLVARTLEQLEAVTADLDARAFLEESRRRSAVLGKEITVLRGDQSFRATAIAIDDGGALVVQTADDIIALSSGEVSLRL